MGWHEAVSHSSLLSCKAADMPMTCCLCVAEGFTVQMTMALCKSTVLDLQAVITGAIQHNAELMTARGGKQPPGQTKRKCSCCTLQ